MFKLFAVLVSLNSAFPDQVLQRDGDGFVTKAECEAQALKDAPDLIRFFSATRGWQIDRDYTVKFECRPAERSV